MRLSKHELSRTPALPYQSPPVQGEPVLDRQRVFEVRHTDASKYVLRIWIGDKPRSWELIGAPSADPDHEQKAIPVDDDGKGETWDAGTYGNITRNQGRLVPLKTALRRGGAELVLRGQKLRGAYSIIKDEDDWALRKLQDSYAQPKTRFAGGVLTGRTAEAGGA